MKQLIIFAVGLSLSGSVMAWGNDCDKTRSIERVVDVASAELLKVEAGAGELEIRGEQRNDIVIRAELCSDDAETLASMDVATTVNGATATVVTQFPKGGMFGDNYSARIDLTLIVPERLNLNVNDSSGEASVVNVASLEMIDSSGGLRIEKIAGNVSLVDSSGGISLSDILGDVSLTDSSGDISAAYISGNFTIDADSSGDITINDAAQDVLIKRDSSGSIEVNNVGGEFTVEADTSGSIDYKNVTGKVSLPPNKS